MRVLLIEDNPLDADLIRMELDDAGFDMSLHTAETRSELESALQAHDWQLVICDSRLPGMDGVEAHAMVREVMPAVPFVFCIGAELEHEAFPQALADAQGCVSKNELTALPNLLREVLSLA